MFNSWRSNIWGRGYADYPHSSERERGRQICAPNVAPGKGTKNFKEQYFQELMGFSLPNSSHLLALPPYIRLCQTDDPVGADAFRKGKHFTCKACRTSDFEKTD